MGVRPLLLPEGALLGAYEAKRAYTDCYTRDVDGAVAQADYVRAFYTSPLFQLERFVLKWAVAKPSTDVEAAALAAEECDRYAAWTVEGRTADQLLMSDYQGRTRSWLMTMKLEGGRTRLYFGSAIEPLRPDGRKDRAFGFAFHLLLGFHKLYARALLRAAGNNLKR